MTLLFLLAPAAQAVPMSFDVVNNSSTAWEEGLVALLDSASTPSALMEVGATPTAGDAYETYRYVDESCGGALAGDGVALAAAWGLTLGVDAWLLPPLAPGGQATVTIDASPGQVMSLVARVSGSGDDAVLAHAVGDPTDTTIDLFNSVDLPLFNVRFDISGYDANSTDPADGDASSCSPDCPVSGASSCFVAVGNGTIGTSAGGPQPPPAEPDFGVFPGYALSPEPGSFYENGVGSPTVLYHANTGLYVMFFETRLATTDPDCPVGMWGIGSAVSLDGWSWTVVPAPVIAPTAGTYHSCVAAHPTAVIDPGGFDIHLWFKAEQERNLCGGGATPPPWGCAQYVGVGYAKFNLSNPFQPPIQIASDPVLPVGATFGFPSVVRQNGTWTMIIAEYPHFREAHAAAPGGPWTLGPIVMEPGVTVWSEDDLYNPSLVCEGGAGPLPAYPFTTVFGGRNRDTPFGPVVDGGVGEAISTNALSWLIGITPFTFTGDLAFRHWDAVRVGAGAGETLLWFSEKDASGVLHVGLAATADEWDPADIHTRICPQPSWW